MKLTNIICKSLLVNTVDSNFLKLSELYDNFNDGIISIKDQLVSFNIHGDDVAVNFDTYATAELLVEKGDRDTPSIETYNLLSLDVDITSVYVNDSELTATANIATLPFCCINETFSDYIKTLIINDN